MNEVFLAAAVYLGVAVLLGRLLYRFLLPDPDAEALAYCVALFWPGLLVFLPFWLVAMGVERAALWTFRGRQKHKSLFEESKG